MPLLSDSEGGAEGSGPRSPPTRKQSQHSFIAKTAIMNVATPSVEGLPTFEHREAAKSSLAPPPKTSTGRAGEGDGKNGVEHKAGLEKTVSRAASKDGVGAALTDTPATTAPNSPKMSVGSCSKAILRRYALIC